MSNYVREYARMGGFHRFFETTPEGNASFFRVIPVEIILGTEGLLMTFVNRLFRLIPNLKRYPERL